MIESCGLFIVDKTGKLLICRPRGIKGDKDGWGIPKGKKDDGEELIDAAFRETLEESGLDLKKYKKDAVYMGSKNYVSKKKRIHAWYLKIPIYIDTKVLSCMVKEGELPEIDKYELIEITNELQYRIHEAQFRLLKEYSDEL